MSRTFHMFGLWAQVLGVAAGAMLAGAKLAAQEPGDPKPELAEPDRVVYIPYQKIEEVFGKDERGVYLPFDEFQKLWDRAYQSEQPAPREAQVAALIGAAFYFGNVDDQGLVFLVHMRVESLREGWVRVPLAFDDVAVESAQLGAYVAPKTGEDLGAGKDAKEARFRAVTSVVEPRVAEKGAPPPPRTGSYELLLDQPGAYTLSLRFHVGVQRQEGADGVTTSRAAFGCPPAPMTKLVLEVPASQTVTEISPHRAMSEGKTRKEGRAVWQAFLGATERVSLTWTSRSRPQGDAQREFRAEVVEHITYDPELTSLTCRITVVVGKGKLEAIELRIPDGYPLARLPGPNVQSADIETRNGARFLNIRFHQPVTERAEIVLSMERIRRERDFFDAAQQAPLLWVEGASRVDSVVAVAVPEESVEEDNGRMSNRPLYQVSATDRTKGLEALETRRVPWVPERRPALAFKTSEEQANLELKFARISAKVRVESGMLVTVQETDLRLDLQATVTIEDAGVTRVAFIIPNGLNLDATSVKDPRIERVFTDPLSGDAAQGATRKLIVNFRRKLLGRFPLTLRVSADETKPTLDAGAAWTVAIPLLYAEAVSHEEGYVALALDENLEIVREPEAAPPGAGAGDGEAAEPNLRPLDIRRLVGVPAPERPASTPLVAGYRYQRTPITLTVRVKRKPTRVSAMTLIALRVENGRLSQKATITYTVEHSPVRKFLFRVRSEFAEMLDPRFPGKQTVTKTVIEGKDAPATVEFLCELQSDTRGELAIEVEHDQVLPSIEPGRQLERVAMEVIPVGVVETVGYALAFEEGYLAFYSATDYEVAVAADRFDAATQGALAPIDQSELPADAARAALVEAFKYASHPVTASFGIAKLDFAAVQNLAITTMEVTTRVERDRSEHSTARFLLRNNQGQELLFHAPKGVTLDRVQIDGQDKRYATAGAIKGQDEEQEASQGYLIKLAHSGNSAQVTTVEIKYRRPLGEGDLGRFGAFTLNALNFGDIPVDRFRWEVELPAEYHYLDFDTRLYQEGATLPFWRQTRRLAGVPDFGVGSSGVGDSAAVVFTGHSGQGAIAVSYLDTDWFWALDALVFVSLLVLIFLVPRFLALRTSTLAASLFIAGVVLGTVNAFGFSDFFVTMSAAGCVGLLGLVAWQVALTVRDWSRRPRIAPEPSATLIAPVDDQAPENPTPA